MKRVIFFSAFVFLSCIGLAQEQDSTDKDDKVFVLVQKEAKFPGGMKGWIKFLTNNLRYDVAASAGAPAGMYTVKVQFVIDSTGNVGNVRAIEVPVECIPCGPEAVRVIKLSPTWKPATQNGKAVIYQALQNISFQVAEEGRKKRRKE